MTASRLMDLQDVLLKLRDDPEVDAKNPRAIIDVRAVDLDDHESVIIFGKYVERQYTSIDIVNLNVCCSQPSTKPGSTTRMKYSPSIFQIVSCRSSSSVATATALVVMDQHALAGSATTSTERAHGRSS
jgi:hypothetical protein